MRFTSEDQINEYFTDQVENLSEEFYKTLDEVQAKFRRNLKRSRDAKEFALARLQSKKEEDL